MPDDKLSVDWARLTQDEVGELVRCPECGNPDLSHTYAHVECMSCLWRRRLPIVRTGQGDYAKDWPPATYCQQPPMHVKIMIVAFMAAVIGTVAYACL